MKHLKVFKTEEVFDSEVMVLDKAWVTLTEDDAKAHFMEFKTSAAWVGGGEADCVLGGSEEYTSESPVELYETKKLTEIKFPAEATELVSLDSTNLETVDLSECEVGSPIIEQVKDTVGDDVEVIEPTPPPTEKRYIYYTMNEENANDSLWVFQQEDGSYNGYLTFADISYNDVFKSFAPNDSRIQKYSEEVEGDTITLYGIKLQDNEFDGENYELLDGSAYYGDYEIDFEFKDDTTEIPEEWLAYTNVTHLSENALDGITSIGDGAFGTCSSLTNITIPNSVTSIGTYAFYECSSLTSITIGSGVTSIGEFAFSSCSGLTSVTIPNNVTSIGNWAFAYCSSLTSIEIPSNVTSIGEQAFRDCLNLTSITIPNSVTSIGEGAFYYCSGLTSIEVDPNNTVYHSDGNCCMKSGEVVFGCKNSVIPSTATSISEGAFLGCTSLTNIEIPNSVTTIGDYAFSFCTSLTSIEIPNSVTSIGGNGVFYECSSLTSVTIGNGVTSIGSSAFKYCSSLTSVTYNGTISQWNAIPKGSEWKNGVPTSCIVHCTDGDIAI